jgi:hypothetical protein
MAGSVHLALGTTVGFRLTQMTRSTGCPIQAIFVEHKPDGVREICKKGVSEIL